jgi:fumarylacetoacetate (FAA) hydrolase
MYQGGCDDIIGPMEDIAVAHEAWGIDFEAEVAVITDDVPMGATPDEAQLHIKLLMLVNDVSLRNLFPPELAKGFGFLQSKPALSFSPVAVTPDELGDAWKDGKVHLPLRSIWNGKLVGQDPQRRQHRRLGPSVEQECVARLLVHCQEALPGNDRGWGGE